MIVLWIRILVIFIVVVLFGCENNFEATQRVNPVINFVVPEDGKLVKKQVTDYISIRKQVVSEANARKKTTNQSKEDEGVTIKNSPEFRYFDEIEKAVANKHGMSYREYLWIKDTIITTQTRMWLQHYYEANNKIVNLLDSTLTRYRHISKDDDKQEQQKMAGYVTEMRKELTTLKEKIPQQETETEAHAHNARLITRYKSELDALN